MSFTSSIVSFEKNDAVTTLPAVTLPALSTVIALEKGLTPFSLILLIGGGAPALTFVAAKVLLADPVKYSARKYMKRYTLLPFAGITINSLGALLVLLL
jgi:hypothetical protein